MNLLGDNINRKAYGIYGALWKSSNNGLCVCICVYLLNIKTSWLHFELSFSSWGFFSLWERFSINKVLASLGRIQMSLLVEIFLKYRKTSMQTDGRKPLHILWKECLRNEENENNNNFHLSSNTPGNPFQCTSLPCRNWKDGKEDSMIWLLVTRSYLVGSILKCGLLCLRLWSCVKISKYLPFGSVKCLQKGYKGSLNSPTTTHRYSKFAVNWYFD